MSEQVLPMHANAVTTLMAGSALAVVLVGADLEAFGFGLGGAMAFVQILLLPLMAVGFWIVGWRRRSRESIWAGSTLLFAVIVSLVVSSTIAARQMESSQDRGDGLCTAIAAYHQRHGRYPERLTQLVPEFAEQVPVTAMGLWSEVPFRYELDRDASNFTLWFDATFGLQCTRRSDTEWRTDD